MGTAAGNWAASFRDIALVNSDGGVVAVYSGQAANPVAFSVSNGATNQASQVNLWPGRYEPSVATTYYHEDQIGSSRLLVGSGGWPVWQGTFLPFGQELNPQATTNHYKFSGKERDAESGLDYFGARYYSSTMGRWMSGDWSATPEPVPYANFSDPQTLNLYTYVRDLPTTKVDGDGHDFWDYLNGVGNALSNNFAGSQRASSNNRDFSVGQKVGDGVSIVAGAVGAVVAAAGDLGADIGSGGAALVAAPVQVAAVAIPANGALQGARHLFFSKKGDTSGTSTGPKANDAPGVSASGQATDEYGNKLGGSGKPQQHSTESTTREGAHNRALNDGSSAVNHSNPKDGSPHFHAGDADGNKRPNSTHHNYPD